VGSGGTGTQFGVLKLTLPPFVPGATDGRRALASDYSINPDAEPSKGPAQAELLS